MAAFSSRTFTDQHRAIANLPSVVVDASTSQDAFRVDRVTVRVRMRNSFRYGFGTAAVLTLLAASQYLRPSPTAPAAVATTAVRPATAVISMQAPAPQSPPVVQLTLAAQVDQLIASHDPVKAFAAYTLISDCATFNRDHDRFIYDIAEVKSKRSMLPYRAMNDAEKRHDAVLCAGMSERMRLSRIDYLAVAAKAGVDGAAIQMAQEGPFGDPSALLSRPDDPLVQEWKHTVMDQLADSAERGDMGVLAYLWAKEVTGDALTGKHPALAYRYVVAQGLILRDLLGPDDLGAAMYGPDGGIARNIEGLSAEQRAAELSAAQRIAEAARAERERARRTHG